MKKNHLLGCSLVALIFLFTACNSEDVNFEFNQKSLSQQTTCGEAKVVSLIAGQHVDVGTVTVTNDNENLYVTYETNGDWSISETHLYVGPEEDIPQTGSGNPKIGHFPYHGDNDEPFVIPLADLEDCFVVVAHAVVNKVVNNQIVQSETAFGCGEKEFSGRRWGCYFEYCKQDCTNFEEVYSYCHSSTCFVDDGFDNIGWTTGPFPNRYSLDLYTNIEGCDPLTEAVKIGRLKVRYNLESMTGYIEFVVDPPYQLEETYVYLGNSKYPLKPSGEETVDPQYYNYSHTGLDARSDRQRDVYQIENLPEGNFYVIGNAKVSQE